MKTERPINSFVELKGVDNKPVIIKGKYITYNPMPNLKFENPLILSGILLEGDSVPRIFLEQPRTQEEQNIYNDKSILIKGVFHLTQPTKEGDPSYSVKLTGSWIYDIEYIQLCE